MIVFRTLFFYLLLLAVIRLMGKRQVAQMEPSEFAVTMLVANLASIALEEPDTPIWSGAMAMGTVLVLEYALSIVSLRSVRLRRVLCGKPVILIDNGQLLMENLRATRVNLDELSGHLREKGILDFASVQFAILETNGAVTVFPFPHCQPPTAADLGVEAEKQELPYTVISDGRLIAHNLRLAGKNELWLQDYLHGQGCTRDQVALLTLTPGGKTHLIRRNQGQEQS